MKGEQPEERFIRLPHRIYDSSEFYGLEAIDVRVLLHLIRQFNGFNNGAIAMGLREIAAKCGCSKSTAARALERLQRAKLIELISQGHLVPEVGRPNVASRWRITFIKNRQDGKKWTSTSTSTGPASAPAASTPRGRRLSLNGSTNSYAKQRPFGTAQATRSKRNSGVLP